MESQKNTIPSNYQSKWDLIYRAIPEVEAPELSSRQIMHGLWALINKNLTIDSLVAMLALIFVYLTALISPIKTLCLRLPKAPVFPAKSIKAVQFLSFT